MQNALSRRHFIECSVVSAIGAAITQSVPAAAETGLKKGIIIDMLSKQLDYLDRFRLAKRVGFDGIEAQTITDPAQAEAVREASRQSDMPVHSVMNMLHWKMPLSSNDPSVVAQGLQGMETSLHNARLWGAGVVLLVPAVVNPDTSYSDAWKRSQKQVRKLIPLAKELRVIIAVENVWNKFLLSPLEFARYVDEFNSPWVKAYFDVGNILLYGYPQDWIHTLGKRIVRIHIKDFKTDTKEFVPLREGNVPWPAVHNALSDIGYSGFLTAEVRGGDESVIKEIAARMDLILAGKQASA